LKNFNIFINENNDFHAEIDPYQEENWSEDDENVFDMDDFRVEDHYTETLYTVFVKIKNYDLKFRLTFDDEGYSWLEFVGVEGKIEPKILDKLKHFIEENEPEIKDLLLDECG
jgi:hypothetical protein